MVWFGKHPVSYAHPYVELTQSQQKLSYFLRRLGTLNCHNWYVCRNIPDNGMIEDQLLEDYFNEVDKISVTCDGESEYEVGLDEK